MVPKCRGAEVPANMPVTESHAWCFCLYVIQYLSLDVYVEEIAFVHRHKITDWVQIQIRITISNCELCQFFKLNKDIITSYIINTLIRFNYYYDFLKIFPINTGVFKILR